MNANSTRLLAFTLSVSALPAFAFAPPAKPAKSAKPAPATAKPAPAPAKPEKRPMGALSLLQRPPNLASRLQITPEQKSKLDTLQTRLQSEMQALYGKDHQILPEKFQEITRSREKAEDEAMAVLTAKQRKEFEAVNRDYLSMDGIGASALRLISVTNLSDEQKTKLKTLANDTKTKRSSIVVGLAKGGDQKEITKKLQEMETETQAAIKKILTAAQQTTFDNAFNTAPTPTKASDKPAPSKLAPTKQ